MDGLRPPKTQPMRLMLLWLLLWPAAALCADIEFGANFVINDPLDRPLPKLSMGYGTGFQIAVSPMLKWGLAIGIYTTRHDLEGGVLGNRIVQVDSRRYIIYVQGQYRVLRLSIYELEATAAAVYDNINGGDSTGSYLVQQFDPEEIGYSGWGANGGINIKRAIQAGYLFNLGLKYNVITYSTHQVAGLKYTGAEHRRRANSLVFYIGVAYRVNFDRF